MCDYTITFYNAQVKGPMVVFFIFFTTNTNSNGLKKIYMYIKAHVGTYMLTMKYSSAILFLNILKLMLSTVNYIARHLYKLITAGSWIQSFFFLRLRIEFYLSQLYKKLHFDNLASQTWVVFNFYVLNSWKLGCKFFWNKNTY